MIERLTFQSRPGVRVTANLYRPRATGHRLPGVLSVHGHWAWARIDPVVQTRCIALARLGYVCLCVDAFGSGERAIEPAPGTYHGGLVGASLWPVGTPLLGLQVYDNRRAVDYLISRPGGRRIEPRHHGCLRRRQPDTLCRRDRRAARGRCPGLRHRDL